MILDFEIDTLREWLTYSALTFLIVVLVGAVLAGFFSYIFCAIRHGPIEAFYIVGQTGAGVFPDFGRTSPRRVLAIAMLAARDAMRKRIWVSLVVFFVILMYAQWFLDQNSEHPEKIYIAFVMTTTSYLILGLSLFLSTFSLPQEIKDRTIYTIVTKPVRPHEIIIGRILGFAAIGTMMVVIMCFSSLLFVERGLGHSHGLDSELSVVLEDIEANGFWEGQTTFDRHHRHQIRLEPAKKVDDANEKDIITGKTDLVMGHVHTITIEGLGEDAKIIVSPPQEQLVARVPVFGDLGFYDRNGAASNTGINVGEEWAYRGYIEGGTLGKFEYNFSDVTQARFPNGLPVELNLSIFRTHKGVITRGVLGTITLVSTNPDSEFVESAPIHFNAKEYVIDRRDIAPEIEARRRSDGKVVKVNLFDEFVNDGNLQLVIQCSERGQYFGSAKRDVYLRAADQSFRLNFVKGFTGIWLQMLVVMTFGVAFSTFLSGPIAMLVSSGMIVLGMCRDFIDQVLGGVLRKFDVLQRLIDPVLRGQELEGVAEGGGPVESIVRIVTQQNVMVELDAMPGITRVLEYLDIAVMTVMYAVANGLPDLSRYNNSAFVAQGFNVDNGLLIQQFITTAAFCFVLTVVSYFCLKTREIAA
jgi:hypothetical protein